ncbi:unnamed protein product, partial [Polarella glacialis]
LCSELGGGSQGRVYTCTRLNSGNQYAVKIVNTKAIELRENTLTNLRREINIMRELHHPRIVNLQVAFWEGSLCFIVMDFARGGDLYSKLERGQGLGSELASRHVAFQLLEGIGYMHSHKVIHRDLKPENVLVTRTFLSGPEPEHEMYDVKIGDFGLSKVLKRVGESDMGMTACGTLDYLAPEVFTGQYDERIDLWSFGVLLYMMLCGAFPFEIESWSDFKGLAAKRVNPLGAWQLVSPEAQDLAQGLLTVDPAERLGIDACFRHPWLSEELSEAAMVAEASSPDFASGSPENAGDASPERQRSMALRKLALSTVTHANISLMARSQRRGVVKQISGCVGDAVDNVEMFLHDGSVRSYGGKGGVQRQSWHLHHNECILAVAQETRDAYVGNSLVFYTSESQIISLQGREARNKSRLVAPYGSQITGLQFEGNRLTGIYLELVHSDGRPSAVEEISGSVGSAVDNLAFKFRDGSIRRYGKEGGVRTVPKTLGPDEYIILVEQGRRETFLGNSLAFFTSLGNIIELKGLEACRSQRFVAPAGCQICGLKLEGSLLVGIDTCPMVPSGNGE